MIIRSLDAMSESMPHSIRLCIREAPPPRKRARAQRWTALWAKTT